MVKLHKLMIVNCLVLMIGLFTACQKKEPQADPEQEKQTLNFVERQELQTADISLATDQISFTTLNNIYEGIYRLDQNNVPQPAGAVAKATVSEDGLHYRIKLKKEARWSDGVPVKAKDYVYSWQRTVDPDTTAGHAYMFQPVKNAQKILKGELDKKQLGIRAINDYELEITLEKATPYFDYLLALPVFFPQRQDIVEKHKRRYAKTDQLAVYNGPFVLSNFDGPGTDTTWVLKKNTAYWDRDNVKLQKVNISVVKDADTAVKQFQNGQTDDTYLTGSLAKELKDDPHMVTQQVASIFYLELNQRSPQSPYSNINLRKALSYAIDRESLVDNHAMNGSTVAKGLVTGNLSFDPVTQQDFIDEIGKYIEYSPELARSYWEKAKQELGIDSLDLTILVDDTDNSKRIAEFLQITLMDTLKDLKVEINPLPFAVRLDRSNKGDFQLSAAGWSADYADPSSFLSLFTTDNPYNRGGFSNQEYDNLVSNAETIHADNPNARWQDMLTAEKILMKNMGAIPLYQQGEARLRADKVKGVVFHSTGAKYDFKWAYIEE
jgi:oligopeptide transport system substrate-binding protein